MTADQPRADAIAALRKALESFAELLEAEWYNGNMTEAAYERLNGDLTGITATYIGVAALAPADPTADLRAASVHVNDGSAHDVTQPCTWPAPADPTAGPSPDHPIWTLDVATLDYVIESLVGIWSVEPDLLIESAIADVRAIRKYPASHEHVEPCL